MKQHTFSKFGYVQQRHGSLLLLRIAHSCRGGQRFVVEQLTALSPRAAELQQNTQQPASELLPRHPSCQLKRSAHKEVIIMFITVLDLIISPRVQGQLRSPVHHAGSGALKQKSRPFALRLVHDPIGWETSSC